MAIRQPQRLSPVTQGTQLVLAGGGHSHALLLRRWAMHPRQRPKGLITLVNRSSTTLYSGMVPGLIAGLYKRDQVAIDLRRLATEAGVAFDEAEIKGLDVNCQDLCRGPTVIGFHEIEPRCGRHQPANLP